MSKANAQIAAGLAAAEKSTAPKPPDATKVYATGACRDAAFATVESLENKYVKFATDFGKEAQAEADTIDSALARTSLEGFQREQALTSSLDKWKRTRLNELSDQFRPLAFEAQQILERVDISLTASPSPAYELTQVGLFGDDEKYARIASKIDKQGPAGLRNLATLSITKGGDDGRLVAAAIADRLNSMTKAERDSVSVSVNELANFHCSKSWREKTARLQDIKAKCLSILAQYKAQTAFALGTKPNPDLSPNDKIRAGLAAHTAARLKGQSATETPSQPSPTITAFQRESAPRGTFPE